MTSGRPTTSLTTPVRAHSIELMMALFPVVLSPRMKTFDDSSTSTPPLMFDFTDFTKFMSSSLFVVPTKPARRHSPRHRPSTANQITTENPRL